MYAPRTWYLVPDTGSQQRRPKKRIFLFPADWSSNIHICRYVYIFKLYRYQVMFVVFSYFTPCIQYTILWDCTLPVYLKRAYYCLYFFLFSIREFSSFCLFGWLPGILAATVRRLVSDRATVYSRVQRTPGLVPVPGPGTC